MPEFTKEQLERLIAEHKSERLELEANTSLDAEKKFSKITALEDSIRDLSDKLSQLNCDHTVPELSANNGLFGTRVMCCSKCGATVPS